VKWIAEDDVKWTEECEGDYAGGLSWSRNRHKHDWCRYGYLFANDCLGSWNFQDTIERRYVFA